MKFLRYSDGWIIEFTGSILKGNSDKVVKILDKIESYIDNIPYRSLDQREAQLREYAQYRWEFLINPKILSECGLSKSDCDMSKNKYSGTPSKWTLAGPNKVSVIERVIVFCLKILQNLFFLPSDLSAPPFIVYNIMYLPTMCLVV